MKFNIGPLQVRLLDGHDLFYCNSKLSKNFAFEFLFLGFRPAWKGQLLDISVDLELDKKVDHSPSFQANATLPRLSVFEFSFHNVNHSEANRLDEEAGFKWEWKEESQTWETRIPVLVNGQEGEWHIWIEKRQYYCDRGRWHLCVDGYGCSGPDDAEGFPRYYFDIDVAKDETREWVKIRKEHIRRQANKPV